MIKRIIELTHGSYVHLHHHQLVIEQDGQCVASAPAEDVGLLLLAHPANVITQQALACCQQYGVAIAVCDEHHLPSALMLPLDGHSLHAEILRQQVAASPAAQAALWQAVIRGKISAQAEVLAKLGRPGEAHLRRLAEGESVDIPRYDFITGTRQWHNNPLTLDERSILIVEGIHGLNPRLTPSVPEAQKFRIYISCFTSVAMDNLSRIATTDNRLLRRLTRDYTQRGADAVATLSRWGSVRRGEEKHIFPYQENADVMLNSSLFYEISVLRPYAEKILREVPDTVPEYDEARRMLKFLKNFTPIPPDEIPPTSIIREFIGGSSFKY